MANETFHAQIAANQRRSLLLVAGLLALFAVTLYTLAVALLHDTQAAIVPAGLGLAGASLVAICAHQFGASAVTAMAGARTISRDDDPQLWNVIEEMTIAAGLPMPRVALIEEDALNAFAAGPDPKRAVIAITRGLRDSLTREELQAVVAHELGHVRNLDIRFSTLLAVMVGMLVFMSEIARRSFRFSGRRHSTRGRGGSGGSGGLAVVILTLVGLLLAILAPLLGRLIQLAASREREYLADATAVQLTRHPEALANALEKLGADATAPTEQSRALQHLYFVNPFERAREHASALWSTHPPLAARIARLRSLVTAVRTGESR